MNLHTSPHLFEKLNKKVAVKVKVYKLNLTYKISLIHFILQLHNVMHRGIYRRFIYQPNNRPTFYKLLFKFNKFDLFN